MTDTILVNDLIAERALPHFINNCKALRVANRDYEKDYNKEVNGYNTGDTLRIRKPSYYPVNDGEVAVPQSITELNDSIVLNNIKNITFDPSNVQLTTDMREMDMFETRVIMPAMISLANAVDKSCVSALDNSVYLNPGVIGNVNSFTKFNNAKLELIKYAVPEPYFALMNPTDSTNLQNALQNAFNTTLNSEISIKGILGELAGVECYWDQNVNSHTNGINSGTPLTNTAGQTGSSLITDGWTFTQTGILKKNDIITIAGVYGVNPVPPNDAVGGATADLMKFRVTADVDSDGGGNATIPIFPAITTTGVYRTVSAAPGDGAAITVINNTAPSVVYPQNYMLSRAALSLAVVPLRKPEGAVKVGMATDEKTGVSFRVIDGYDIITNKEIKRLDILYGVKAFPQYADKF